MKPLKPFSIPYLGQLALIAISAFSFFFFVTDFGISQNMSPHTFLTTEFRDCFSNKTQGGILGCMNEKIPHWIKIFGVNMVSTVFTEYEDDFGEDFTCHLVGHTIGENIYTYSENGLQEALKTCSYSCHSGCVHGATGGFVQEYGAEALFNLDIEEICGNRFDDFGKFRLCSHGIGHSIMLGNNYETLEALNTCSKLEVPDSMKTPCYGGVFMELFGATLGHIDIAEEKYKKEGDIYYPCTIQEIASNDAYSRECYIYLVNSLKEHARATNTPVFQLCKETPDGHANDCALGIGIVVASRFTSDLDRVASICRETDSTTMKNFCLLGAVAYLYIGDDGKEDSEQFCKKLTDDEVFVCDLYYNEYIKSYLET